MKRMRYNALAAAVCAVMLVARFGYAHIEGVEAMTFNLVAKDGFIQCGDGMSVYTWGYANGAGPMQYPGVTMIAHQGEQITVNLGNELAVPVSIVFPGQQDVVSTGGVQGLLTREAPPGGSVRYTFTANNPGTFQYHSGTRPEIQVEMGLFGALVVHPHGHNHMMPSAYTVPGTDYTHEFLFLASEMDPRIHIAVYAGGMAAMDSPENAELLSDYFPLYWFLNGRNAPDTMLGANVPWLPHQPYNCMPMMNPGEKLLMRVVGAGRDLHPFHYHGNHARVIAKDAVPLKTTAGAGVDLSHELFTISVIPGETVDAIFTWTGEGLGWDIYGHAPGDPMEPGEYAPDHGKPIPVNFPAQQDLAFGGWWSGSPFLGQGELLPPGQGGMNPNSGFVYMWHSHSEKEMTNYDIFPGGMMTMLMIDPPGVDSHH